MRGSGLVALLVLAACETATPAAEWCTAEGSEPVVIAPPRSLWERSDLQPKLAELWRRGGTREGEEMAFPLAAAVAPNGAIAFADFQLREAPVVDRDGFWAGAWTRRGSGPGEVIAPIGVAWDEHNGLLVLDAGRGVLVRLAAPETLVDETAVPAAVGARVFHGGGLEWAALLADGTVLLQPLSQVLDEAAVVEEKVLLLWKPGFSDVDTVASDTSQIAWSQTTSFERPGAPRPLFAAVGDRFAISGTDERYRIHVIGTDLFPIVTICRAAAGAPLTAFERGESMPDEVREELGSSADMILAAIARGPALPPAPMGRLFFGNDKRLWVQRERPLPLSTSERYHGVPGARYDVYAPDGVWLGEVVAPARAGFFAASADRVYSLEQDLDGALWLVAYSFTLEERVQ